MSNHFYDHSVHTTAAQLPSHSKFVDSWDQPEILPMFYFTPPYEMAVKTSIGTEFIKMVKEEFPPDHPYHHILNEHT